MTKNFKANILIRVLVISTFIALLLYFVIVQERYLRSVYILIFLVGTIAEFLWYVDKTNRDFTAFLLALLQNDFTTTFSESGKGRSFGKLYNAFNKITNKFKQISTDKEVQYLYLEALVEHLRIGVISFDKNEKIQFMNQALQRMFGRPHLAYLDNLAMVSAELPLVLREIKPQDQRLVKIKVNDDLLHLSLHASEFILDKEYFKLISVQNIKNELDSNELDAWQKLIRVLTHEIMNSVTPITSLSETLKQIIDNGPATPVAMEKVSQGLHAIKLRSSGLRNFTQAYRKLTKIPTPNFIKVNLKHLLNRVFILLEKELNDVRVDLLVKTNHTLLADPDLLEQVFINLIKNAIEATEGQASREINIQLDKGDHTFITIADNGRGIDTDKLDKIFIPFFTTKDNGSGIGLALSRQIIHLHNGIIKVRSSKGHGTSFLIQV